MTLSVTGRARLLNALVGALLMALLVVLARSSIRRVLYDAVDRTLREQAQQFARGPGRGGPRPHRHEREPDLWGFGDPPPRRREPPPLRFGTTSLRHPRIFPLGEQGQFTFRDGEIPWSSAGLDIARRQGQDIREETDRDGLRLRTLSLRTTGWRGDAVVVQTAAELAETEAALEEIGTALYLLLLPLALIAGVLSAMLTDLALAPVRQLTRTIAALEANRLTTRLPTPGGGDTLDQLVTVLNGLLDRIDAAFARQKRFTADASHELRTPLTVVKAATSLLLNNPQPISDLQRRTLAGADQAADRANRLVADLLLLARTDQGALPVQPVEVVLSGALQTAIDEAIAGHAGTPASVALTCPETLRFCTDPDHLHRLVVNLMSNALRHTPPEGRIALITHAAPDDLTLTIADTGEGIAAERQARLGEPFYRPDASRTRSQGGAGLGLAICKGIVAALGGEFAMESAPGQGTTVQIRLPALRASR